MIVRIPLVILVTLTCFVSSNPAWGQSDAPSHRLTVLEEGRFILGANDAPFFWLGDTAWELFHRTTREEADLYLQDRADKGFTVIQAVVLAEQDGLNVPNAYGDVPLLEKDPLRPNEGYFKHVDYIVDRAASLGMYIGMLPTWGDKFNQKWGLGPVVFTPENAFEYGRFLGERYADDPVIWILGGDRNPEDDTQLQIVREMARGIEEATGGAQLMTYHPQGGGRSWEWFQEDEWLDVHLFQSGHGAWDSPNYHMTSEGYALEPPRPVIDGEPRYEDHPVDWDTTNGWFNDFDVRQAAYWSMLSGAAGHTYGNHNIWQMWQDGREPVSWARTPWKEAVLQPGSTQMGIMRRLFEERNWSLLVPDQTLLNGDARKGAEHARAARASDGSYAYVYLPYGHAVEVNLADMRPGGVKARWFDPRTGSYHDAAEVDATSTATFDPPGEPERGNDWVLVLEAKG